MTELDEVQLQVLLDKAAQELPGMDFTAGVMRQLERQARRGQVLAIAQGVALLALLVPLSLFVEGRLFAWLQAATQVDAFAQSTWWLAGFVIGCSLLLAPSYSRAS